MRTNVVLDDRLVDEAMRLSDCRTKRELIHRSIEEFVKRRRQRRILDLAGKIKWEGDLDALRRDRF